MYFTKCGMTSCSAAEKPGAGSTRLIRLGDAARDDYLSHGYFPQPIGAPACRTGDADYLASLAGPADAATKTEAQKDFTQVARALRQYAEGIGANRFEPGWGPAKTGLGKGSERGLVK